MKRRLLCLVIATAFVPAFGSARVDAAAPGDPDPAFGVNGALTNSVLTPTPGLLDEYGPVTVDSAGRTVVLGLKGSSIALARYLTNGAADVSFSGDGFLAVLPAFSATLVDVRVLANGSIVAMGDRRTDDSPFSNGIWIAKVSGAGELDPDFGTGGLMIEDFGYTAYGFSGSVGPDGSTAFSYQGIGGGDLLLFSETGVSQVESGGPSDEDTLPAGCSEMGPGKMYASVRVSSTQVIVLGETGYLGETCPVENRGYLSSITTDGANQWRRYLSASESVELSDVPLSYPLSVVGGDVLFQTEEGASRFTRRYTTTGSPVVSWGVGGKAPVPVTFATVNEFADAGAGTVAVVMVRVGTDVPWQFVVDRLLPNGSADPSFARQSVLEADRYGSNEGHVAVAPDRGIHVAMRAELATSLRRFLGVGTTLPPPPDLAPLEPGRLLDTRAGEPTVDGQFAGFGRAAAGSVTKVKVAGRGGVPADASAAFLNLTIIKPEAQGFAAIYPCSATPPSSSSINYVAGAVIANASVAKLSPTGEVCVFAQRATDIAIDVNGAAPAITEVGTLPPARLLDTRAGEPTTDGQFAGVGRAGAGSVTKVKVAGRGGVPANASTAILNVTMIRPQAQGFATIYPCSATPPAASSINYGAGVVVANLSVAKLSASGEVCVFAQRATDIAIDVNGFALPTADLETLPPARLLDSRPGEPTTDGQSAGAGRAAAGSITRVKVAGRGGVPADATAVVVNAIAIAPSAQGFLVVYPCTPARPTASNVNYPAGSVVANGVFAKLSPTGEVCVYTSREAHLVLDVNAFVTG